MSAGTIIAKIPWAKLSKYGPIIAQTAKDLYDRIQAFFAERNGNVKNHASLSDLDERVTRLEKNEVQQAKLVSDIGQQISALTSAVQQTAKRTIVTMVLAVGALLASLAAIVLCLLK